MKYLIVLAVLSFAFAAEEAKEESKTFSRLIPADVLRDFPGLCFASTRCATVEVGNTWDLAPFCGRSTCVLSQDEPKRLLELVEDCGPLPVPNPKCKLDSEKTNKTAPFPGCCPIFTCEDGVVLEYPKLPVVPEEENKEEVKA